MMGHFGTFAVCPVVGHLGHPPLGGVPCPAEPEWDILA